MRNATPEACQSAWLIFKRKAELIPGVRFGNVPTKVKWPTRTEVNIANTYAGHGGVSKSTFAGFKRLFREGREYQTRNEIHYPGAQPDPAWVPVAFGAQS